MLAGADPLAAEQRQQRAAAQLLVIVRIYVAQRQPADALHQHGMHNRSSPEVTFPSGWNDNPRLGDRCRGSRPRIGAQRGVAIGLIASVPARDNPLRTSRRSILILVVPGLS